MHVFLLFLILFINFSIKNSLFELILQLALLIFPQQKIFMTLKKLNQTHNKNNRSQKSFFHTYSHKKGR